MNSLSSIGRGRRALLGIGIAVVAAGMGAKQWTKEDARFTSPSVGNEVEASIIARGFVSRQLADSKLWVVVGKLGREQYYPQEGRVLIIPGHDWELRREWVRTRVTFGELGPYEMRIYQVNDRGNQEFLDYLRDGQDTGKYQPFGEQQLQTEQGFVLRDRIEVIRRA